MKKPQIYKPEPLDVIRLEIRKTGENKSYLTTIGLTQDEMIEWLKTVFKDKIDPFAAGFVLGITVREGEGVVNGKSKSIAFKGMSVEQAREIIIKAMNE